MAGIWVLALAFSAWGQLCWAGQHYFVRLDGNDQHSGLSPARAWRSIDRLNRHVFTRGDTVYLALWYSPECKIIVLSITYVNISTFQHPEKRVRQCARPLRSHSISLM
jgi:hypothetical protein